MNPSMANKKDLAKVEYALIRKYHQLEDDY